MRIDLESAREQLATAKDSQDPQKIKQSLQRVRQMETMVISSRAKIANDSVLSLHHQLKSSRDQMRMEQAATVRQLQTSGAGDNELLVGHTEAQKRLISTLEKHVDTLVEQHQHLLERTKQKQLDTMQKYRQLVEGSYNDKILRLECLLHELITDSFQT